MYKFPNSATRTSSGIVCIEKRRLIIVMFDIEVYMMF
jgi:hypothetical protein